MLNHKNNQYILVARKKIVKSTTEKVIDFVATPGNQRYFETYFYIKCENQGCKIVEKYYVYERIASDFRNIISHFEEEFDNRQEVLLKIEVCLLSIVEHSSEEEYQEQLFKLLNSDKYSDLNEKYNLSFQFVKLITSGVLLGRQAGVEVFKIMNNAIWRKGLDQFVVVGGKKLMVEGTTLCMKKGGKYFGTGTIKEVIKVGPKKVKLIIKPNFSFIGALKGLGISLLTNLVIGGIKSYIMSGWEKEEKDLQINTPYDFDFSQINEIEEQTTIELELDSETLDTQEESNYEDQGFTQIANTLWSLIDEEQKAIQLSNQLTQDVAYKRKLYKL